MRVHVNVEGRGEVVDDERGVPDYLTAVTDEGFLVSGPEFGGFVDRVGDVVEAQEHFDFEAEGGLQMR